MRRSLNESAMQNAAHSEAIGAVGLGKPNPERAAVHRVMAMNPARVGGEVGAKAMRMKNS